MFALLARFLRFLAKKVAPPVPLLVGPDEIVPGTQKPSIILANMVRLAIQQEPARIEKKYLVDEDKRDRITPYTTTWSSTYRYTWIKDDKIKVLMDHKYTSGMGSYSRDYHYTQIFINGNLLNLTSEEAKVVVEALFEADTHMEKVREVDKEANRQHSALAALESLVIGDTKGESE